MKRSFCAPSLARDMEWVADGGCWVTPREMVLALCRLSPDADNDEARAYVRASLRVLEGWPENQPPRDLHARPAAE